MTELLEYVGNCLKRDGYGGLSNDDGCACHVGNLMPCDEPTVYCAPCWVIPCTKDKDEPCEWCEAPGPLCFTSKKPEGGQDYSIIPDEEED